MSETQGKFEGWAVVELFGHSREIGFVTTQYFGDKAMFQIDVPEREEREVVLPRPQYVEDTLAPKGSTVRLEAAPGRTRIIGPSAVYAINPCDREAALVALDGNQPRPMRLVALSDERALPRVTVDVWEAPNDDQEDEEL